MKIYTYIVYFALLFQHLLILSFSLVIADGWLQACWKCIWLMQHLSTAHGLPKLRQRSTRSTGGWQTFSVSACQKKANPRFSAWIYWKLLHILIPVADCLCHGGQTYKIASSSFKSLQAASCLLDREKGKKIKWFKKKCHDSKVNLLKQLFFSSSNSLFQGDQINSKQLPLLHHNMFATP